MTRQTHLHPSDARVWRADNGLVDTGPLHVGAVAPDGDGLMIEGNECRPPVSDPDCTGRGEQAGGAVVDEAPLPRPSRRTGGRQRRHRRVACRRRAVSEARLVLARDQQRGVRSWLHVAEAVVQSGEGRVSRAWGVARRLLGPLDALSAFGAKRAAGFAEELRAAGEACGVGEVGWRDGSPGPVKANRGYEVAFVMRGLVAGVAVEPRASSLALLTCVQERVEEWLMSVL